MNAFELTDGTGYKIKKSLVDLCLLTLANRPEGANTYEIQRSLFDCEIGNAQSADRYELSYSSTGAIFRSAVNELRSLGMIVDTFGQSPYTIHITNKGADYLATINVPQAEVIPF